MKGKWASLFFPPEYFGIWVLTKKRLFFPPNFFQIWVGKLGWRCFNGGVTSQITPTLWIFSKWVIYLAILLFLCSLLNLVLLNVDVCGARSGFVGFLGLCAENNWKFLFLRFSIAWLSVNLCGSASPHGVWAGCWVYARVLQFEWCLWGASR